MKKLNRLLCFLLIFSEAEKVNQAAGIVENPPFFVQNLKKNHILPKLYSFLL